MLVPCEMLVVAPLSVARHCDTSPRQCDMTCSNTTRHMTMRNDAWQRNITIVKMSRCSFALSYTKLAASVWYVAMSFRIVVSHIALSHIVHPSLDITACRVLHLSDAEQCDDVIWRATLRYEARHCDTQRTMRYELGHSQTTLSWCCITLSCSGKFEQW